MIPPLSLSLSLSLTFPREQRLYFAESENVRCAHVGAREKFNPRVFVVPLVDRKLEIYMRRASTWFSNSLGRKHDYAVAMRIC